MVAKNYTKDMDFYNYLARKQTVRRKERSFWEK